MDTRFAAGHSVSGVKLIQPVAALVARVKAEWHAAGRCEAAAD